MISFVGFWRPDNRQLVFDVLAEKGKFHVFHKTSGGDLKSLDYISLSCSLPYKMSATGCLTDANILSILLLVLDSSTFTVFAGSLQW